MNESEKKMTFDVSARRVNAHGSLATTKAAEVTLDTDLSGRQDAFNPAELLMAALAGCMLKNIERVIPILKFELDGVAIRLHGVRQDKPPRMESIAYEIRVATQESDRRLELLHDNIRKFGTVYNTVAPGTALEGKVVRA